MEKQIINPSVKTEFSECYACKKSLIGKKLSKYHSQFSGEFTHESLLKPLREDPEFRGITGWLCPFCGNRTEVYRDPPAT